MEQTANIRVNKGSLKIEVNDEGEYIELFSNNVSFYNAFADFLRWMDAEQEKLNTFDKELSEKYGSEITTDRTLDEIQRATMFYKDCVHHIDEIFGRDTCRKVFGDIIPDEILIGDFLEQITPIVSKLAEERGQYFQGKYNRNRKGGKKK